MTALLHAARCDAHDPLEFLLGGPNAVNSCCTGALFHDFGKEEKMSEGSWTNVGEAQKNLFFHLHRDDGVLTRRLLLGRGLGPRGCRCGPNRFKRDSRLLAERGEVEVDNLPGH